MLKVLFFVDTFTVIFALIITNLTDVSETGVVNAVEFLEEENFKLDENEPVKTINSFCPASFCSTNETISRLDGHGNRCCIPCDCARTCHFASTDTHADIETLNFDSVVEKCVRTSIGASEDGDEYILIQSCPMFEIEGNYSEVAGKCLQPNKRKLDEIMPVYSTISGKNYRNIYCANCNNDYSVKAWKSKLIASDTWFGMVIPNSVERASYLLEMVQTPSSHLTLKWEPAPGTASLCFEQDRLISTCNYFNSNFEKFERLCSEIYAPVRGEQDIYKNVFCLACNKDINYCLESERILGKQPVDISLKLEVYAEKPIYETADTEDKTEQCMGDMVYDSLLEQCIRKACPVTQVKSGDRCVQVIDEISGVNFDYRLKLSYPKETFIRPSADQIFADVRHVIIHDNDTSAICAEHVLETVTEEEHVAITIQLTKSVTKPTSLYADFILFKDKVSQMNARALNGDFAFTVKHKDSPLVFASTDYVHLTTYIDFKPNTGCTLVRSVTMTYKHFCESVMINDAPCDKSGIVKLNNGITFLLEEYIFLVGDRHFLSVCYDLYVLKARSFVASSSTGRYSSKATVDAVVMLLSAILVYM